MQPPSGEKAKSSGPKAMDKDPATSFTLKDAGQDFEGRKSNIFGGLDQLEQKHMTFEESRDDKEECMKPEPEIDSDAHIDCRKRRACDDDDDAAGNPRQGHDPRLADVKVPRHSRRERKPIHPQQRPQSGFRRPTGRAPGRQGRVPDHRKHPDSWTFYSLEDVKGSDMSQTTNTQAALAFLDERRKLRQQEEMGDKFDVDSAACSKGLFSFAKHSKPADPTGRVAADKGQSSDDKLQSSLDAETADLDDTEPRTEEDASSSLQTDSNIVEETTSESTKLTFKSRKGIKRHIRSRDEDDD